MSTSLFETNYQWDGKMLIHQSPGKENKNFDLSWNA
jgi:hypothetical protein